MLRLAGKWDDCVDALGLIGQVLDRHADARLSPGAQADSGAEVRAKLKRGWQAVGVVADRMREQVHAKCPASRKPRVAPSEVSERHTGVTLTS